jgi:hypothetical protein
MGEVVYGIRMYNYIDECGNMLYERKYDVEITTIQKRDVYRYYQSLDDKDVKIEIYTECWTSYNDTKKTFIMWSNIGTDVFTMTWNV